MLASALGSRYLQGGRRGQVSWVSPIARALMKAVEGDVVELRTPNGVRRIEVLRIVYEEG